MTRIDGFLVMEYNKKDAKLYQNKRIMKVGHHGSNTSSSEDFIAQIHPKVSVISSGYQNYYGHPHKEVLNTLHNAGSYIVNTQYHGSITIMQIGKLNLLLLGNDTFSFL